MLNITYAEQDAALAKSIQKDVSASGLTLDHSYLLVLLSRLTLNEAAIQTAIDKALQEKQRVVPVIVEAGAPVPSVLQSATSIDLTGGYRSNRLIGAIKRMELGEDRITRSWRMMIVMLVIVAIAFVASVWGITRGVIRFPAEEYATENARTDATLQALVGPTLQLIVPHTTEEAAKFQATLDAMPRAMKNVEELAIGTATAQAPAFATATAQP